jgi:linoleoyl-CoA desaturase
VTEQVIDLESLRRDLDDLRARTLAKIGDEDRAHIERVRTAARCLEASGRLLIHVSVDPMTFGLGVVGLGLYKIIENMELGHNVMHGQWDWMNDPEVHSVNWEWDNADPSAHWKITHNYAHHKYTNVLGMDDDIGFGLLRVTRDQRWKPFYLGNLAYNAILAALFQYGLAIQLLELGKVTQGRDDRELTRRRGKEVLAKLGRQTLKDYVVYPALTGKAWKSTVKANAAANLVRNLWTNAVIFCGHFPDGAEKFTKADVDNETHAQWYLRQMLGSANISGGPVMDFMTGNLSYQIEHHIFPDLPSNRYREISIRVKQLCDKYDLPYTTGPLAVQYWKSWRTIAKLSLPDKYLTDTRDAAPETASEAGFGGPPATDPLTGRRIGLATTIETTRKRGPVRRILGMR